MNHPAIAQHLRATDTTDQGATYLADLHLGKTDLIAVAAALGMTRVEHLTATALRARIVQQAIGARRKYAGLRTW
ncbi:hypothetical protein [Actinophytocola sediminis]